MSKRMDEVITATPMYHAPLCMWKLLEARSMDFMPIVAEHIDSDARSKEKRYQ